MRVVIQKIALFVGLGLILSATSAVAQTKKLVSNKNVLTNGKLTDQQQKGKFILLQRCSLCHLPSSGKDNPDLHPPVGPSLEGIVGTPDEEKAVREFILQGTPDMPGYQYTFNSSDLDSLIAYLKTL